MFFHFVFKFNNVVVDFCESCKKSGVISKVYAFDLARLYCCAQSLKKSASGIFIRNGLSMMSAIFD